MNPRCFKKSGMSLLVAATACYGISAQAALEEVVVTDSIPLRKEAVECGKFKVLTVSKLLGEAIKRIHNSDSVSSLFV